jgi:PAS domain S-box-containing protein
MGKYAKTNTASGATKDGCAMPMIGLLPPAVVEVDANRRYIAANQIACELLGYDLDELLKMRIDDISAPSGAHVPPMFERYRDDGMMHGSFALLNKAGQTVWILFEAGIRPTGRMISTWTHYEIRETPSLRD